jgi:hypothetical protein
MAASGASCLAGCRIAAVRASPEGHTMLNIEFRISDEEANSLSELARRCALAHAKHSSATTHGALDLAGLLALLIEDAVMIIDAPDSCEAKAMGQLLRSHGYEI